MPIVGGGTNQSTKPGQSGTAQAAAPLMPFIRASQLRREQPFLDTTKLLSATGSIDLGSTPVPAYGFLRSICVRVTTTVAASGGTATAAEDSPFSLLQNIFLSEPNGAIIYQANNGYETYLHNKYGGYAYANDPKAELAVDPTGAVGGGAGAVFTPVSATSAGSFFLRIPVELRVRDGLGSLPNQNAAATFLLRMSLASTAAAGTVFATNTNTTQATVRVQCFAEYWDQPPQTIDGVAAAQLPPAVATTQFWTTQQYTVNTGLNTIRFTRMGNYIRNLICVFRTAGTTRATGDSNWPDPSYLYVDIHQQDAITRAAWIQQVYERYGYGAASGGVQDAAGSKDVGVWAYDFCHEFDGQVGHENNDLWLPTKASSRVELQGIFGAAGVLTVLTNDVAVVGNVFM
jgi:hypothetical protein